ncbi:MAG: hypothetical protein IPK26_16910 [Planctomycetes bacterium]|nr:hypothetical protein [Planctomycetota bacterium]
MSWPRLVAPMALATAATAQGTFVNYEDPQVKPIAVATLGGQDHVLACNTPDNSIEIYRAEWSLQPAIARVPVGLSPVTVKWHAPSSSFYTCNFLGDSVSRVRLDIVSTSPLTIDAVLEQTEYVGNEPADIAFDPAGGTAVVALHAAGQVRRINLADLSGVTPPLPLGTFAPAHVQPRLAAYVNAGANLANILPLWGVKQARRLEILPDNRAYVLNTMGGEISARSPYDLGLFAIMPSGTPFHALSGVGTTNLGCAVNAAGDRMYVVSQIAQNVGRNGVVAVQLGNLETGFVQTWLQVIDLPVNGPPVLLAEQILGPPPATGKPAVSIDLNRDYLPTAAVRSPVPVGERLAQVTDVIVVPPPSGSSTPRIVLAAFGSDRIAVLRPDPTQASGYARTVVDLAPVAGGYGAVGPRGLAYSATAMEPGASTPGLVFALNRLDNSIAVVSPWTAALARRALTTDPTPASIRAGRKFLYTAKATSGTQMVSCSSCHVDARTDGLRWRLGDTAPGSIIEPRLIDVAGVASHFAPNKPEMVTQTLQGLVDCHLEPDLMQFLATNAPYHWRGDKNSFQDFNEAFVNLQGMQPTGAGAGPEGISSIEMDTYTAFVNTIHHPPNPEQLPEREFGSNGLVGRDLFHTLPALVGRSCVNCHALPEGSNNMITEVFSIDASRASVPPGTTQNHPFETAALRNVLARELLVPATAFQPTPLPTQPVFWPIVGTSGLLHGGAGSVGAIPTQSSLTLNDNVFHNFALPLAQVSAITEFVRQLDTGSAPLIGFAWTETTVTGPNVANMDLATGQARAANVGVAAYLRVGALVRGYWYDPTIDQFVQEGGTGLFSRNRLQAQVAAPGDVLIVQVTPAASERRVASLTGITAPLAGPAPTDILPLGMVPNTAYVGVTSLVTTAGAATGKLTTLTAAAQTDGFVPALRHEPPRRFRVAGNNIRHGAKLGLAHVIAPAVIVWFDLTATDLTMTSGERIWETTDELDALQTMAHLCGGYLAPGVLSVLSGDLSPAVVASLDPQGWNWYYFTVRNEDQTTGVSSGFQLVIDDLR